MACHRRVQKSVRSASNWINVLTVAVSVWAACSWVIPAEGALYYSAGSSTVWDTTSTNWGTSTGGPYNVATWDGSAAVFEGTGGAVTVSAVSAASLEFTTSGYSLSGGTVTLTGSSINTNANSVTIGSAFAGGAGLNKTGTGTLILSGTNSYTGGTTVSDGVLQANSTASLQGSTNVASNGTLRLMTGDTTWSNTITGSGLVQLQMSGGTANTYLPNITGFAGIVELTTAGTTGTKWNTNNVSAANAAVKVTNNTQLFVVGASTFAGVQIIGTGNTETRGAIRLTGTLNAPVTLMGNATIGNESGTINGTISTGVTGTQTLTMGTGNSAATATLNGVLADGTGVLALTTAYGTTTLTNTNTYSGTTTITGSSVLRIGNGGATGTLGTGNVVDNSSLVFNRTGTMTVANAISGTGSVTQAGTGTTILTGANSYGATTISAGTLQVGNGGATGTLGSGAVTDNATLVFSRSDTVTITNTIGGTGTLTFNGTGISGQSAYVLSGANTSFTGTIQVNNARLGTASATNLGSASAIYVTSGGQVYAYGGGTYNHALTIAGNGWLEGAGSLGALRLEGNSTWAGAVTLSAAARIGTYGGSGNVSGNIALGSNALELYTENGNLSITGNLVGSGAVTKTGNYSVFLGGDNSGFTGTYTAGSSNTFFNSPTGGSAAANWVITSGTLYNNVAGTPSISLGSLSGTGGQLANNLSGSTVTYAIGARNANTAYGGTIANGSGTTAIVKTGTGSLTLTGANTYTGGTTINSGTLSLSGVNRLSTSGAITTAGGTLDLGAGSQTTSGAVAFQGGTVQNGTISKSGADYDAQSGSVYANLAGSAGLTKTTAGTLILGGANTYTGATVISQGTIQLQAAPTSLPTTASSAIWRLDASDAASVTQSGGIVSQWNDQSGSNRNVTASGTTQPAYVTDGLNGLNVVRFDGSDDKMVITGAGGNAAAQTIFIVESLSGTQKSLAGIIGLNNADVGIRWSSGAWQTPGNGNDFANPTGSEFRVDGVITGTQTSDSTFHVMSATRVGSAQNVSAIGSYFYSSGREYKGDIGEVIVYGTTLSAADRNLVERYLYYKWFGIGATSNILPTGTAVQLASGATLDLNSVNQTIGSLADHGGGGGNVLLGSATLTTGGSGADTAFSGAISGAGNLVKTGTGTFTLSGTNAYAGTTTVGAGTLLVNGTHSGGGLYTVAGGATLGGSGTITAPVTVETSGSMAPGNSAGTLNTGSLTLLDGSILDFELGTPGVVGSGVNDLIHVTGDLDVDDGTVVVDVTSLSGFGLGTYTLITYSGDIFGDASDFALGNMPGGIGGYQIVVNDFGPLGGNVQLMAVPEPSSVALAAFGLLGLLLAGWRRHARRSGAAVPSMQ
jgi:fibronectin-binding autotransporter adhesin